MKKYTFKNRTFSLISVLFLLMTGSHKVIHAVESFPFEFVPGVNEYSVLATSIESEGDAIWLGTLNGLVMIHSGETKLFNVLSGHTKTNHVSNIALSESGEVWAALVGGGVFYFNRKTQEHFLLQDRYPIEDINCFDVEIDKALQKLLLACDSAFYTLDLSTGGFKSYGFMGEDKKPIDGYISLAASDANSWLIGTWGNGLLQLDKSTLQVQKISLATSFINHINIYRSGKAMLATNEGVFEYDIKEQITNKLPMLMVDGIEYGEVRSTVMISENIFLFAVSSLGLFEYNLVSNEIKEPLLHSPILEKKHIGFVDTLNTIQNGVSLAIGADERGFFVLPLKYSFTSYLESSADMNPDLSMIAAIDKQIFMGDWNSLIKFKRKQPQVFTNNIGATQFLIPFENGYLASTLENGFVKLDEQGQILIKNMRFKGIPDDANTSFSEILEITDGDYLLGKSRGQEKGLYRGDFSRGFSKIRDMGTVSNMLFTSLGKIIITSSYKGIVIFDPSTNEFEEYFPETEGLHIDCLEKINNRDYLICLRRNKALIFNTDSKTFSEFLPEHPVLRNIRDATLDKNGLLWLSSSYGLYVYDTHDEKLIRITKNEGVKSNDFSVDGMLLQDNRLIIPGNKGIVEIDVDKAKAFLDFKKTQKTDSFVTQAEYILDEQSESVQAPVQMIEQGITLPHSNIVLKLKFSHNNFLELDDLAFDVRMLGLSNDWNTLDVGEYTATFTTLQPGDYEFQVRVNDPRSDASQPIQSVNVVILPPWWRTPMAYASYIFILLIAFYFFAWLRNMRLLALNKKLTAIVKERTDTVDRLLKQKQTFFANVSHEFRTPLSLITGPLDLVAEAISSPELKKHLSIMKRNTNRLMKLVDQILDLARIETNKSLPKQVYELKSTMELISASFLPLLESKQQKLLLEGFTETKVRLVEDSFEMIMTNLISNAHKYCQCGAEIVVSLQKSEVFAIVLVKDNGPGICSENLEIIFERFTRFDAAENIQGSGLGLALVKQLATSNGGDIEVESKVGSGTTFSVRFPLNVKANAKITRAPKLPVIDIEFANETSANNSGAKTDIQRAAPSSKNEVAVLSKPKILIVEDNADLRLFLSDSLQENYEIDIAINGQQGLKQAQEAIPDLILSDVLMPVMDGYELANAIRSDEVTSHIPIVLITAKGDDLSRMKGWAEQVDDYISKPFKLSELQVRIKRLITIRDILRKKHTSAVANNLATKNHEAISFQTKKDAEFFSAFEKVISEHYGDEHFSRTDAAELLNMVPRQLNRKLSALMDYNFSEYLRKYRLQKSTELLLAGKQVTEVAYDVGFNSPSYFSSCFKAEFDETPSKYVERCESEN